MGESKMELEDWLDDLCVRFIINLPAEDLSSVARICFQVEEAQWFYEDFIRPLDPTLPSMTLRGFCLKIFQHCPLLASFPVENHMRAFEEFLQYKTRVPVRGAIMLNEAMDSTVLVKGWKKGANWSFPRGKINKDEDDLDCAIREVYEETGFDIRAAGLVPKDDQVKFIEINMREQQLRLYVFRNVPMDTHFEPKTRKEISRIEWYKLSELPAFRKKGANNRDDAAAATNANRFYMVAPFLVPLKKWVVQQRKRDGTRAASGPGIATQAIREEALADYDPAPRPSAADASPSAFGPAIDTFEGATRELQRLLNVQPPASGPVPQTLTTGTDQVADEGQSKGSALLAILQSKPMTAPVAPAAGGPASTLQHSTAGYFSSPVPSQGAGHAANASMLQGHAAAQQAYQQVPSFAGFQLGPRSGEGHFAAPPTTSMAGGASVPGEQIIPSSESHRYGAHEHRPPATTAHPAGYLGNSLIQNRSSAALGLPGASVYASQSQVRVDPQPYVASSSSGLHGAGNRLPPPQLDRHAMSLLNAFTTNNSRGPESGSGNFPVLDQVSKPGAVSSVGVGGHQSFPGGVPSPAPAGDQHKNALLDMFMSQGRALARNDQPSNGTTSGVGPSRTSSDGGGSSVSAHGPINEEIKMPDQSGATMHLPFSALKLLRCPEELWRGDAPTTFAGFPEPAAQFSLATERNMSRTHAAVSPAHSSAGLVPAPLVSGTAFEPASSASSVPAQQAETLAVPPRPETSIGQKNLLLSLFGKSQAAPSAEGGGKGKEAEQLPPPAVALGVPSTRNGSGFPTPPSGPGEASQSRPVSRRGSQTPISSADRSFLLGYLQSVTK